MEESARGSYARWRSAAGRSRFCTDPASASCAAIAIHSPMQVSERVELNVLYAGVRRFARDREGVTFVIDPFPEKPKRMRWATYGRLIEQANEAELEQLKALGYSTESKSPGQGSAPK